MKIVIEISDEEIMEEVRDKVSTMIANEFHSEWRNSTNYCYHHVIKDVVRDVIKQDKDNLSDRAVAAAAKSIENSAVKKMLNQIAEGGA